MRAAVAPGFALADRIEALRAEVARMNLPAAYTTTVSGRGRELERTFTEFLWAFLLSIIFMYMILASQFESLAHPFTILLSLPLSMPFALFSLWASGNTLNLYSALGILVLFGVVKKNSILQVDHMNHLRAEGLEREEAIIKGNRDRLRPILMTTLALVAGMLPLWVGTGPGAEERRAVAVVVIGGQSLSLILTLIVTPVAYSLLDDLTKSERWRWVRVRVSPWTGFVAGPLRRIFSRRKRDAKEGGATTIQHGRAADSSPDEILDEEAAKARLYTAPDGDGLFEPAGKDQDYAKTARAERGAVELNGNPDDEVRYLSAGDAVKPTSTEEQGESEQTEDESDRELVTCNRD